MGSETPTKLPLIDFSKIYLNELTPDDWNSIKTQVHEALTEYGFFRASMAGMSSEFQSSLFSSLDQLFSLPSETKLKSISDKPFHGYIGHSPTMPLYESMAIPDAQVAGEVEAFTNFFWPHGKLYIWGLHHKIPFLSTGCIEADMIVLFVFLCSESVRNISDKLYWLDRMIRKMIMESLRLEKHMDDHMDNTKHLLRVAKYQGPDTQESIMGLVSHIDKTTLSILYQNEVAGLELESKGGEWIRVEQSIDSFTVFVGEVFHAWSNGLLHAPYHRVMMTGNEARYSLGLFSVPKPGYITKVPDELVDEEHPLLFNPFDYDEFLKHLFTGKIGANEDALDAYCGVKESELTTYSKSESK
ncbi:probable 2-oxoglutarate-dependent dioxygenase AOP1 [Lactuca sativa]|uniref:probable 2-oxoglutarate-dependent dioxygenase AOP1 n=1 Tax=Lactuca sativa TaxID=4236 RepID=UPI000CD8C135|nr:probable 2-oxoglutarate-dependent dioxygenase AOP1 [Lactuca sativa]